MQQSFHEFIDRLREKQFINNADFPNRFYFDGHPSTSKVLVWGQVIKPVHGRILQVNTIIAAK